MPRRLLRDSSGDRWPQPLPLHSPRGPWGPPGPDSGTSRPHPLNRRGPGSKVGLAPTAIRSDAGQIQRRPLPTAPSSPTCARTTMARILVIPRRGSELASCRRLEEQAIWKAAPFCCSWRRLERPAQATGSMPPKGKKAALAWPLNFVGVAHRDLKTLGAHKGCSAISWENLEAWRRVEKGIDDALSWCRVYREEASLYQGDVGVAPFFQKAWALMADAWWFPSLLEKPQHSHELVEMPMAVHEQRANALWIFAQRQAASPNAARLAQAFPDTAPLTHATQSSDQGAVGLPCWRDCRRAFLSRIVQGTLARFICYCVA